MKKLTISKKQEMKRLTKFQDELIDMIYTTRVIDVDAYKKIYLEERNFIIDNFENAPDFLKRCRTYESLITYLISLDQNSDTWKQSSRIFINKEFSNFLNSIEFNEKNEISEASFSENTISIILQKEVFNHVKTLLNTEHYFNAVEESYKIVREKLKLITGKEKAHEAFKNDNFEIIFGHQPQDEVEEDFFEGVKFLHMAIQKLRNEKSHTPAGNLDKNLALHYIVLASLAYDLINRNI